MWPKNMNSPLAFVNVRCLMPFIHFYGKAAERFFHAVETYYSKNSECSDHNLENSNPEFAFAEYLIFLTSFIISSSFMRHVA